MRNRKLKRYLLIATVILVVLAIVGKKAGWFGQQNMLKVTTAQPQFRKITELVTASGKIQPETEVKISPDVSGEIVELYIKEGDKVKQGKLLLKIKPDTYLSMVDRAEASLNSARANFASAKAQLAQVESRYNQAQKTFERNKTLWKEEAISESEYENATSSLEMAEAELEGAKRSADAARFSVESAQATLSEARENLSKTSIFAPMAGTVSRLSVEQGERVVGTAQMAGTEMLRIADLSRMEVLVEVNENDIVRVKQGDTARVEVDAYLGEKFLGVVTEIANSANIIGTSADQVTNFEVKILLLESSYQHLRKPENPNPFRPGMSATVDIQTNTRWDVLSVPIQAVTTRVDTASQGDKVTDTEELAKEVVFVVSNDSALVKQVETGIQDTRFIEIISGLDSTHQVVVSPFSAVSRRLREGMKVEVVEEKDLFNEE
ncbi:MAG: efflux RND transporter periplasmic adaptor subunit [Bacteroidales bacterium]